jgi:hypothetical protein
MAGAVSEGEKSHELYFIAGMKLPPEAHRLRW